MITQLGDGCLSLYILQVALDKSRQIERNGTIELDGAKFKHVITWCQGSLLKRKHILTPFQISYARHH